MEELKADDLTAIERRMLRLAVQARSHAYAPYSKYSVGCCLLDDEGGLHSGCNVENACYNVGTCAERAALYKMISRGKRTFVSIVLICDSRSPVFPCGACLQALLEHAGPDAQVMAVSQDGKRARRVLFSTLLPSGFSKKELKDGI